MYTTTCISANESFSVHYSYYMGSKFYFPEFRGRYVLLGVFSWFCPEINCTLCIQ